MKRVKVLTVNGQVINRGGQRVKTLSEVVESAINAEIGKSSDELVNVKIQTEGMNQASSGGSALIVLVFEGESKKKGGDR